MNENIMQRGIKTSNSMKLPTVPFIQIYRSSINFEW